MFLNKIRNIFCVPSRNKCCACGQTGKHLCRNNVSATMCPCLPGPLVAFKNLADKSSLNVYNFWYKQTAVSSLAACYIPTCSPFCFEVKMPCSCSLKAKAIQSSVLSVRPGFRWSSGGYSLVICQLYSCIFHSVLAKERHLLQILLKALKVVFLNRIVVLVLAIKTCCLIYQWDRHRLCRFTWSV